MEQWKDIPGYEGLYQASNLGRIKSLTKTYKTGKGYYRTVPEKIISGNKLSPKGYKRVKLPKNVQFVHRVIALTWIPNPLNKQQINHIDGNKLNNRVENLEWATNQENRDHAVRNGLIAFDTDVPSRKLSKDQVFEIRRLYSLGVTQLKIANQFNVVQQTISDIVLNKSRTRFYD